MKTRCPLWGNNKPRRRMSRARKTTRLLFEEQGGKCAKCGEKLNIKKAVKHHKSAGIIELICNNCNRKEHRYVF
jgi:transcription elongation factor Elf1